MMRRASILAGMVLLAAMAITPAVSQPTDGPIVQAGATEKLAAHSWVIRDNSVPGVPNVGFVVGSQATLVIDTGMGRANGETVLAEALKLSSTNRIYLVTTHVHPEHDLGAQAFPPTAVMIRSNAQVREIAEDGMRTADIFRARSETNRKLLEGAAFRAADVTFEREHVLDLGGVSVKLVALGPSHTQGDTGVWVEADKVLFSGDVAMKPLPAFVSSKASARSWLASLDTLDALKPAIVVPSHGPVGDASYIAAYRTYITRVRDRAAALKADGKTVDQAIEIIVAELKADYPDTSRAAGAIRAAYGEAP